MPAVRVGPSATLTLVGSLLMLVHAATMTIGLVAWARSEQLASWRVLVTMLCVPASLAMSAWLWMRPSRLAGLGATVVLLASLARLGAPSHWGGFGYGLLVATVLFSIPLIVIAARR